VSTLTFGARASGQARVTLGIQNTTSIRTDLKAVSELQADILGVVEVRLPRRLFNRTKKHLRAWNLDADNWLTSTSYREV